MAVPRMEFRWWQPVYGIEIIEFLWYDEWKVGCHKSDKQHPWLFLLDTARPTTLQPFNSEVCDLSVVTVISGLSGTDIFINLYTTYPFLVV
jgi:hypothetical protein